MCVVGGKAAPGYEMAKRIIKLVGAVGTKINSDPAIGDLLKLVFVPDYKCLPGRGHHSRCAGHVHRCLARCVMRTSLGVRGLSFLVKQGRDEEGH